MNPEQALSVLVETCNFANVPNYSKHICQKAINVLREAIGADPEQPHAEAPEDGSEEKEEKN